MNHPKNSVQYQLALPSQSKERIQCLDPTLHMRLDQVCYVWLLRQQFVSPLWIPQNIGNFALG